MGCRWSFYGIPMGYPLDSYEISMVSIGFLWNFYWIPVGFQRYFHDVSMGLLLEFSWDFFVAPMLFHVISMICLWDFCGIPLGFP